MTTPSATPVERANAETATPGLAKTARRLRALGRECATRQLPGRILEQLAVDLGADAGGSGAGVALTGVDLAVAYPPDLLAPDVVPEPTAWAGPAEIARDVMVFLPIAVTWASLWLEFDRYRSEPGNSNFLQLWLNGWGRFAVPAVVVLVSLVILLTALLHVQESRNTEAGDNSVLRREIGELLMQVTYQLTVSASAQARIIPTAKLERAARDISTSTHALTQALTSTTDQLAAIFRPGPEGQFTKALGEWTDSARELGAMGRALTVPQEILNRFVQLRSLLAQEERELAAAIQVMVVELKQTSEVSRATAHAHQAVATEVMEDTRSMGAAMERFVEHSEGLNFYMDALNRVLQSLEDAVGPSVSGPVYPDPAEPGYTGMSNADLPLPDEPDQHRNGVPPQHTSGPRHSPPSSWYSTDQDQNGEEDQDR